MVITTPVVRLAALMDGGVGAIAVTLAPGQTEAVTLPTGTVVEVHRLGQHVTWPAKKRKRA
jgi:hypothetical protein